MATILITGNVELFTTESLKRLAEEYKVVIAGNYTQKIDKSKNIHIFHTTPVEEKFQQLFDVYNVTEVVYVTGYTDGGDGTFGELQLLEKALLECRKSKVEKLILLSTVDSQNYLEYYGRSGEVVRKEYPFSKAFTASQTEDLGRYFADKTQQKTIVLWLPYLAGRINDKNYLGSVFHKIHDKEKIFFPYHREDRVDFLSYDDLIELLCQITEETEDESASYFVSSGYEYTYGDFEDLLKIVSPDVQIMYENYPNTIKMPLQSSDLRKQYGFVPMDNVLVSIGSYYRIFVREVLHSQQGIMGGVIRLLGKAGQGVFKYLEILLAFLLTEFLAQYTSNSVYFQFVDVRLFFIVIIATMYGMRTGIMAAVLECLVLIWQFNSIGIQGVQLFYNIENWVPFAIYIMAGSITGYIKNKKTEEIEFSKKEYGLLRDKYIFLNDVYHGTVQNKGEFKRQILGFKDSFGKIFDAVQKLDSEIPERIFLEGLRVLEDILSNHSIAIYSLDSWQRFGRLMVCSSSQLPKLMKSIKMEDYKEIYEVVSRGDIWKNTELKEGMPAYAGGVFRDGMMVLLIIIQEVEMEQYSMAYMNIFRIMCGLVQSSFLKALRYEELREQEIYYPGTHIVFPERLHELVNVQEDMRQAGVADYVLVKFEDRNKEALSNKISGMIRATDTLGADEDGSLYLLLVQSNRQSFKYVADRLEKRGIGYQIVEKVG